ncbi:hypothetical protein HOR11_gp033 [Lactobacillus phage SA-C12]|uniref:Uncharacterized protein n=1 Tax=Lactobacillus phage SA-C12 TaxID=1755697 RepID=A0A1I9KK68_9CAUD|nr:hypothetical protein HOR11_gp033 [Lactobacillus phage SA-C12]ALY06855.1 hypothetical protein SAC12_033 [Lactobacillus phage SA-C12]
MLSCGRQMRHRDTPNGNSSQQAVLIPFPLAPYTILPKWWKYYHNFAFFGRISTTSKKFFFLLLTILKLYDILFSIGGIKNGQTLSKA